MILPRSRKGARCVQLLIGVVGRASSRFLKRSESIVLLLPYPAGRHRENHPVTSAAPLLGLPGRAEAAATMIAVASIVVVIVPLHVAIAVAVAVLVAVIVAMRAIDDHQWLGGDACGE